MRLGFVALIIAVAVLASLYSCNLTQSGHSSIDGSPSYSASGTANGKSPATWSMEGKREIATNRGGPGMPILEEFYPTDTPMQADSWEPFSPEERMLAIGYEALKNPGTADEEWEVIQPIRFLIHYISSYYHEFGRSPKSNEEMVSSWTEYIRKQGAFDGTGYTEEKFRKWFYRLIMSPVTGKPIEWNHPEFSRGNAYIAIINEIPEAYEKAEEMRIQSSERVNREAHANDPSRRIDPYRKLDHVHVFVRVYGETGIIDHSLASPGWKQQQAAQEL